MIQPLLACGDSVFIEIALPSMQPLGHDRCDNNPGECLINSPPIGVDLGGLVVIRGPIGGRSGIVLQIVSGTANKSI